MQEMKKKKVITLGVAITIVVGCLVFWSYKKGDTTKLASLPEATTTEKTSSTYKSLQKTKPKEPDALIYQITNKEIHALSNSKIWGKKSSEETTLKLNYKSVVSSVDLIVGLDSPNGIRVVAIFKDAAVKLPLSFADDFEGINEYGDLNDGYYMQVAEYDFDGDEMPEILVAVGDGMMNVAVNIFKYHPPLSDSDAGRNENWELIGMFSGQKEISLEENTISLPFGSQGLFEEYSFVKNKFIKMN